MAQLVAYAKSQGFVYQGSEIYDGLANSWDYGPLGVELKNNLAKAWWKKFIQESRYNVGVDAAILMNPRVWEASGHVGGFSDPLMDCKKCGSRHRADHLIEQYDVAVNPAGWSNEQMELYIKDNGIACPKCGSKEFTDIRQFHLMFKTHMGVLEESGNAVYLRPETAQGIFVNFKNVLRTSRKKLPFGIGQVGKSFRNEITPGNFIFRTREFEQMELEFFCQPDQSEKWYTYWTDYCQKFLVDLKVRQENIRIRHHDQEELSHYSTATCDIEYLFPMGWGELWGIANRTDYDLKQHMTFSKKSMEYLDPETNEKYIPYCIEPSLGLNRLFLTVLSDAYHEEEIKEGDMRQVLAIHPFLAPFKAAVLPLSKQLSENASEVFELLSKHFMVDMDEAGNIGKRYRRQDAIGTPMCITVDFDTLEDHCVTVRDRDTMQQVRIEIKDLVAYITSKIEF